MLPLSMPSYINRHFQQHSPISTLKWTALKMLPLSGLGVLFLFSIWMELSSQASEYCVTPSQNDTITDCRLLDDYVKNQDSFNWSDATFIFEEGLHIHSYRMVVRDQENLTLVGMAAGNVTVECHNDTGFIFANVQDLTIANLTFMSCGQTFRWKEINSTTALAFLSGHTLKITKVTVDSPTLGGIHTENVHGQIVVTESNFINGNTTHDQNMASSRFTFTECHSEQFASLEFNLVITSSQFINNSAQPTQIDICQKKRGIHAGGVVLLVKCPRVQVSFDHVLFENNTGCFGGGLTIILNSIDESLKKPVHILNSNFINNTGQYGGAVIIDIVYSCTEMSISETQGMDTLIGIRNTNFYRNSAQWEGGAMYIRHKESQKLCTAGTINISQCNFRNNSLMSHGGVVIYNLNFIAYSVIPHIVPQFYVILDSCTLEGNYVQTNRWNNSGSGVIIAKSNPHLRIVNTRIVNNNCSGLVAIGSNVIFNGAVNISNNNASSGGGLVLCSGAILYFNVSAELTIAHNRAKHVGGGILVEYNCRQALPICFFQHLPHNRSDSAQPTVNMIGNHANYSGDNLYGGSIDSCIILKKPDARSIKSSSVFNKLFYLDNLNNSITSIPTRACFCDGNTTECGKRYYNVTVTPGGTIRTNLVLVGERDSPTPGNLEAKIHNDSLVFSNQKSKMVFETYKPCKEVEFAVETTKEDYGLHEIELFVSTTSDISFTEHLDAYMSIYVHVILEKCPFGFTFCDKKCDCQYLKHHKINCNASTQTFHLTQHSRVWLGVYNGSRNRVHLAVSDNCPPAFCLWNTLGGIESQNGSLVDPDQQCQNNRTGILCGKCSPGYSLILGTNECVENCSNNMLSLLVLFLVLGLLLVFFLTVLDLTVAEGTICGILFYANIVQINSDVYFPSSNSPYKKLAMFLRVFIAWLNLDFGISTCFYDGMDSYSKAWLQYLFPLYIWFIAGTIIYLSKRNIRIAALFRSNCVKVLSTLILLSYAKLTRLTMQIFRFHKVYLYHEGEGGTNPHLHLKWASDGEMLYYSREHLLLVIAGGITITILAPYTLCLLFIRTLYKHSGRRPLWWINKWRPFFDTCIGAYTSSGYCWTGLQLLARILVFTANVAQSEVMISSLCTLATVAVLLVIAWWVEPKIYKRRGLNVLEGVSLLNLAFLQVTTVWSVHNRHNENYFAYISALLTVVLFLGVVSYHIYRQLFSLSYFKARSGAMQWITKVTSSTKNLEEIEPHPDGCMPPIARFHHDREPLLAEED